MSCHSDFFNCLIVHHQEVFLSGTKGHIEQAKALQGRGECNTIARRA